VGDFAGEKKGRSVAKDDRKDRHERQGAYGTSEHYMGAALHGQQRSNEECFVANFTD
jgi:hypothetical protein